MKSITIARRFPAHSEYQEFMGKVIKKEIENPYNIEPQVKSLLQNGIHPPTEPLILPPLTHGLTDFMRYGCSANIVELYEHPGGVIFYTPIDSLTFEGYIGHLILMGFEMNNPSYETLKVKLEGLASGNPRRFPKTLEDFYPGVPPVEILQGMTE